MAKQQQPQPKSKVPRSPSPPTTAITSPTRPDATQYSSPPRRSTYYEAVIVYEKGVEALQRHDYQQAIELFESVLTRYPEEKELHERVRLYLNICQRHAAPQPKMPLTVDERLYASTLAINGGRYDEAISHLRLVRDEDPDNDHALYMLAVAHAQRGEHAQALAHLERSIALNPENRAMARQDADLEPLRADDAFRHALDGGTVESSRTSGTSLPPVRPKSAR